MWWPSRGRWWIRRCSRWSPAARPGRWCAGRGGAGRDGRFAAALDVRLGRAWLAEVEQAGCPGALATWMTALAREHRGQETSPLTVHRGVWWVRARHRPVEAGEDPWPAGASIEAVVDAGRLGPAGDGPGARGADGVRVPHRLGGGGLHRHRQQQFAEGLVHARAFAARHGHLAVAHTGGRDTGFDLGRWLAHLRAEAGALSAGQARLLAELDPWWNPPWPIDWQRAWHRARAHTRAHGPVRGGDNLAGLPRRLARWLEHQIAHYPHLDAGQQQLLARLGLTAAEVERYRSWPGRRRPVTIGLKHARDFAEQHGHLAVSQPARHEGFALGKWLNLQRHRQNAAGCRSFEGMIGCSIPRRRRWLRSALGG
ncbi:helicase associated domain-containing protein [Streptomyces sp. SAS_270]|uniref:helicase associated domain-containing protein n=1 Tax=Streptomyces sp. SAS_270 TaxID=3412748 RepID=UPI00403D1EB8